MPAASPFSDATQFPFRPGTHLYPHQGELQGVRRCHLPLLVTLRPMPSSG